MSKSLALLLVVTAAGFFAGRFLAGLEPIRAGHLAASARALPEGESQPERQPAFPGEEEAASALFSAQQIPGKLRRAYEIHRVVQRLDAGQLRALATRVAGIRSNNYDASLLKPLLARWVGLDPDGAAEWSRPFIERVFLGSLGTDTTVCDAWCAADPEAAMALALARPFAEGSQRLIERAISARSGGDPEEEVRRIAALPAGNLRESALAACVRKSMDRSLSEAFAQLDLFAAGPELDRARRDLFAAWIGRDAPAALDAVRETLSSVPPAEGRAILRRVLANAPKTDPEAAFAWALDLPEEQRGAALREGVRGWATRDVSAAFAWAREHDVPLDGKAEDGVWNSPITAAMLKDGPAAIAFIRDLPAGAERDRLLGAALGASQDGAGRELLGELPAGERPGAAQWLGMVGFSKKPDDAIRWAQSLPQGEVRLAAMRGLMAVLPPPSPDRAEAALAAISPGPDRDAALGGVARYHVYSSPAQALDFAGRIGGPGERERAFRAIAGEWIRTQPTAAEAWLTSTEEISGPSKAILLRRLEDSRGGR